MNSDFNTSFSKNIGRTLMTIDPIIYSEDNNTFTYTEDFRIKMVTNNSIKGLLATHIQYINNTPSFCYDISGLQSLSVLLENRSFDYDLLNHLIFKIYDTLLACENYMLDIDMLLLSPDHIYLSLDYSNIGLCYYPLKTSDFTSSLKSLFEFLLKQIDHRDEKSIYIAYSIHNHCLKENITPNVLLSFLNQPTNDSLNISNQNNIINIDNNIRNNSKNNSINNSNINNNNNLQNNFTFNNFRKIKNDNSSSKNTSSLYLERHNDNANNKDSKPLPEYIFKLGIITIISIIGIIIISGLLIFHIIDFLMYIILITVILIFSALTGYNIYKSNEGTVTNLLSSSKASKELPAFYLEDSGSTILLSATENFDSHMLICTDSDNNSQINISHYPFTIGKNRECDLILNNPIISRLHSRISCEINDNYSKNYYIEDLNSSNGTYLNGTILPPYKPYTLSTGDNITFGHLTYIFR